MTPQTAQAGPVTWVTRAFHAMAYAAELTPAPTLAWGRLVPCQLIGGTMETFPLETSHLIGERLTCPT